MKKSFWLNLCTILHHIVMNEKCFHCQPCGVGRNVKQDGDLIIAGLFPVHLYNAAVKRYELNTQAVVWVEAMVFTINEINKNKTILRNVTIGYSIYDTCNEIEFAIKDILTLIMEHEYFDYPNILSTASSKDTNDTTRINNTRKNKDYNTSLTCNCDNYPRPFISLIGGASSKISASVSNILSVDMIPQVSYSSTSTELSNKELYKSFLRTVPPDNFQAQFIIDILKHYNWRYINVLASDDEYGRVGIDHLLPSLKSEGFCVGVLALCSTNPALNSIDNALEKLAEEKRATVTVLWSGKQLARAVINSAARRLLHNITWIATEAWGGDEELLDNDPRVVLGLLGIQFSLKPYQPFEKYIVGRKLSDLIAYRIFHTNKQSENSSGYYVFLNQSNEFRNKISNIVEAVYAVGLGLEATINTSISNSIDTRKLLKSVRNIDVAIDNDIKIGFDDNGDPTSASFMLLNLQMNENGRLFFRKIAKWKSEERRIELTDAQVIYARNTTRVPISKCADECRPGFYAFKETNKKCCWKCVRCTADTYTNRTGIEFCIKCPMKTIANDNHTGCIHLHEVYLHLHSIYGIVLIATAVIELIACILITITFVFYRKTAIVKSSNTLLSLLQLSTAVVACMQPIFYIGKPTVIVCYLRPLFFGVLFTILNSIIFNKADRLLRIFKMRRRVTADDLLLSNKFQILIVVLLAFFSGLICFISYILSPPQVINEVSRVNKSITVKCANISLTTNLLVAYINAIGLTCIVYTFRCRNLPRQYRERRYIGLAMFLATVAWVAYFLVHFGTSLQYVTDFVLCFMAQLSNGVLLMVIYGHKTWNMLVQPDTNNHSNVHHINRIIAGSSKTLAFGLNFETAKSPQRNPLADTHNKDPAAITKS